MNAPVLGSGSGRGDFLAWRRTTFDPGVTWRDLDFIRAEWSGPPIGKGILDPEDAAAAVSLGADGIVVANHGGRQLDGVPSTARALPRIVEPVAGRLTILADGGVRSGLDVVWMLALGADGVLLGRHGPMRSLPRTGGRAARAGARGGGEAGRGGADGVPDHRRTRTGGGGPADPRR